MMLNVLKEFSLSQVIALYMECRLDKRLCKYTIYIKTNISKFLSINLIMIIPINSISNYPLYRTGKFSVTRAEFVWTEMGE